MNVLIVDDDFLPIEQTIRELETAGFDVTHLQDADSAAEYVQHNVDDIDFVIVDVMLGTAITGSAFTADETNDFLMTGIVLVRRWMDDPVVIDKLRGRIALWSIGSADIEEAIAENGFGVGSQIDYWHKPIIENGEIAGKLIELLGKPK